MTRHRLGLLRRQLAGLEAATGAERLRVTIARSPIISRSLPTVTVNSFIEDTSVLVAVAFLLLRGRVERLLANPLASGIAFGVFGASEAVFPNARFPYASHTLACAFVTAVVNWRAGVIAGLITAAAEFLLRTPGTASAATLQVAATIAVLSWRPKSEKLRYAMIVAGVGVAQSASVLIGNAIVLGHDSLASIWTVPANIFGVLLLALVIRDARVRSEAERQREAAIESRRIATEAELVALRTRVQPHFLYNALTSIAALCNIDPKRASKAAIQLGGLMRSALEAGSGRSHSVRKELELVHSYTSIESERYGQRLHVDLQLEGFEDIEVPMFAIQILVENAILHGVSRLPGPGKVEVYGRRKTGHVMLAVADNGCGLTAGGWRRDSLHGLGILEAQLGALGGKLRLCRRPSGGTLAAIRLPHGPAVRI